MGYVRPQLILLDDYAEGVFLASGDGCSYGKAEVTFNEQECRGNQYSINVKASHKGEKDDGEGQKIVLNFSVSVSNVVSTGASVQGSNSGTRIVLNGKEPHTDDYSLDIRFRAESRPNVSAMVRPAESD